VLVDQFHQPDLARPTARPPSKSMRNVSRGMGLRMVWLLR
jgi:hypothetical protein